MKGITPVVATILLLLITISIIGISFMFMQRATQTASQSTEQQLGQQTGQIGSVFSIEGADKNNVYIKNMGARSLNASSLNFYVSNVLVESNSAIIAPGTTGAVALNDSKLAMLPDPAELKVTSAGFTDKIKADFYGKYTVGYWKFDEGSGNIAYDSSSNGNNGVYSGETFNDGTINGATQADGKYGKALKFNGISDYVEAGNDVFDVSTTNDWSITAWINADSLAGGRTIAAISTNSNNYIYLHKIGDEIGWYVAKTGNTARRERTNSDALKSTGTWYSIALTKSGNNDVKVYINGIEDATRTSQGYDSQPNVFDRTWIGRIKTADVSLFFDGSIDEVRIYNKALTQQEIQNDMNSTYPITRTVASYSFEDAAKDTHNWVAGKNGAALSFDGINDKALVLDNNNKLRPSNITVMFWLRADATPSGYVGIMDYSYSGTVGWRFVGNQPGNYGPQVGFGNGQQGTIHWSALGNNWRHIALTYDHQFLRQYSNGIQVSYTPETRDISYDGRNFYIGLAQWYWNGTIDEVRILNTARSMALS